MDEDYKEVSKVVEKLGGKFKIEEKRKEFKVLSRWREIAGGEMAYNTTPLFIVDDTLYVETQGSSWCQEVMFKKDEIAGKINHMLGSQRVKNIKFRITESR
ncbi:MAG: DUF721 domain-containing protein [bacterium]